MLMRPERQARRWLVWCLVVLLPCLGLGIAQRQSLGPWHVHASVPAPKSAQGAGLLEGALGWWWAQVQQQTQARQHARAHADRRAHDHADTAATSHDHGTAQVHGITQAHRHDAWQRHHHGPHDASVIALEVPGEDLGAQGTAASLLLPVLGAPVGGLQIGAGAAPHRAWPRHGAARFSSRATPPPLQPPRG